LYDLLFFPIDTPLPGSLTVMLLVFFFCFFPRCT
jgi:hypothetical protein